MASENAAPFADDPAESGSRAGRTEAARDTDSTADQSALFTVALRDLALVVAAFSLWAGADAWFQVTQAGFAAFLSATAGLLAGAFVGAQSHEWGHFAGARLSGGTAPIAPAKALVPLFNFDFERSDEGQFRSMSLAGNIAHWSMLLALIAFVPSGTPGQLALKCGAFGFAVFASSIEVPVIRKALGGMPGRQALATIRPDGLRRSGGFGLAAALAALILL